jgi:hypothetical protein
MKRFVFVIAFVLIAVFLLTVGFAQKLKKVDFAKKIAEAAPAELPQSPGDDRAGNDARDAGLKGKVKSVIETNQEVGTRIRDPYKDDYYNDSGNLIKTIEYTDGYPESVTVYGFIDKMRVTRSREVTYAEGEKPEPKGIFMRMSDNAKDPSAPRDSRYDRRKVYKYDSQGRLIEESSYQNNGEFWHKTTYGYDGNRRTERGFLQDDGEITKSIFLLDANGNDIEQHMYGENDKVVEKRFMTYEFDKAGNWIVQRTFEEVIVRKKKVRKLLWTSYRTITYYP